METKDDIRWVIIVKSMDDSSKRAYLSELSDAEKTKLNAVLKKYEHTTGKVEHDEMFLRSVINVETMLDKGTIRSQHANYENGATAYEYNRVEDQEIIDSTRRYYPSGQLYSRTIRSVEPSKSVYQEFFESGQLRSLSTSNMLNTWHENGNRSGIFIFDHNQVIKRTLWHRNGKIKEESAWRNDQLNGVVQEWDSLGHQTKKARYVNGRLKEKIRFQ